MSARVCASSASSTETGLIPALEMMMRTSPGRGIPRFDARNVIFGSRPVHAARSLAASGPSMCAVTPTVRAKSCHFDHASSSASSSNASVASDYRFTAPTVPNATASITPATLTPTLTNTGVTKTYDGLSQVSVSAGNYSIVGLINGDQLAAVLPTQSVMVDSVTGNPSPGVGTGKRVIVSGMGVLGINALLASALTGSGALFLQLFNDVLHGFSPR